MARARITRVVLVTLAAGCGSSTGPENLPEGVPATFFLSGRDSLHYTIDLPDTSGGGPFPAFVLVHGSGRQTKSYNTGVSGALVDRGFVAMRFDKRGTGFSGGEFVSVSTGRSETRIPQLSADVAAAVAELRKHPAVDTTRIGLVGVSQAGWIVPHAAVLSPDLSFTLLFVGPTVSVGIEEAISDVADDASRNFQDLSAILDGFTGAQGFDPRADSEAQAVPGLWLFGGADRSIPTIEGVAILQDVTDAHNKPFSWVVYPGSVIAYRVAARGFGRISTLGWPI